MRCQPVGLGGLGLVRGNHLGDQVAPVQGIGLGCAHVAHRDHAVEHLAPSLGRREQLVGNAERVVVRRRLWQARGRHELGPADIDRDGLVAGQAQRPGEMVGHGDPDAIVLVDVDVDQVSGPVRRQPRHEQQIEIPTKRVRVDAEQGGDLPERGPRMLDEVGNDRQHASQPLRRLRRRPAPPRRLSHGRPRVAGRSWRAGRVGTRRRHPGRTEAAARRGPPRPRMGR